MSKKNGSDRYWRISVDNRKFILPDEYVHSDMWR